MFEKIGFVIGRIVAYITHRPQSWIFLILLFVSGTIWIYYLNNKQEPPDVCDCALNALMADTPRFDSALQKKCEEYSKRLTKEENKARATQSFDCPEVKMKLKQKEAVECNCSDEDANNLAFKIAIDFERRQNELESQDARNIRLYKLEKRPNCTWIATFEISYPFGNTDGWHEPKYIEKRLICDGREIYTE